MNIQSTLQTQGKYCSGCGVCANACPVDAIQMKPNSQGFYYPMIEESVCIECKSCYSVCPKLNALHNNTCTPRCFAVWADDSIRFSSSSGGAFTLFAEEVLRNKGVIYGVMLDDSFQATYTRIEDASELDKIKKSKYMQSRTDYVYKCVKKDLAAGKKVLFSGCPCQVAAVKSFCREDLANLYLIDILCTGVASAKEWSDYLQSIASKEQIEAVDFRDNRYGWRCDEVTLYYKDGNQQHVKANKNVYGRGLFAHLTTRDGCEDCEFGGLERQGDISIGDFWGISHYNKSLNDGKGTSIVLSNNEKGEQLIELIKERAKMIEEVPLDATIGRNRVCEKTRMHPAHERFKELYPQMNFKEAVEDALNDQHDIGLVSIYTCQNYGGQLTQYALYRTLKKMGYSTLMIRASTIERGLEFIKEQLLFKKCPYPEYDLERGSRKYGMDYLNDSCKSFLVGSDQMFNYEIMKVIGTSITLDFVDNRKPKIAYAASFGHDYYDGPDHERAYIANMISKFDAFSVREYSAVDLCRKEFGYNDAIHVLDPVFLMDIEEYDRLADTYKDEMPNEPYIYGYILDPYKKEPMLNFLTEHFQLIQRSVPDLVYVGTDDITKDYHFYTDNKVRLEKWIAFFKNARIVFTDSFHGTCMALRFHKEFISFYDERRGNARLMSLLKPLGLQDRIFSSVQEMEERIDDLRPLDWDRIDDILDAEINRCKNWLNSTIEMTMKEKRALTDYDILKGEYWRLKEQSDRTELKLCDIEMKMKNMELNEQKKFRNRLVRKTKGGFKCLREHGIVYTINRTIYHIQNANKNNKGNSTNTELNRKPKMEESENIVLKQIK